MAEFPTPAPSATAPEENEIGARLANFPTLMALLTEQAERRRTHPAISTLQGLGDGEPQSLSYSDLVTEVDALTARLDAAGVGDSDGVAILLPLCPEAVIAFLAASALGVAFPLNPLLAPEAMAAQFALSNTKVIITADALGGRWTPPPLKPVLHLLDRPVEVIVLGRQGEKTEPPPPVSSRPLPREPDRVCALFHTGGTTGAPKLAQLTARNLVAGALMCAGAVGYRPDDRLLNGLPLFHVGGLIDAVLAPMTAGATVIFPALAGGRDADLIRNIWNVVATTQTTLLGLVPTSLGTATGAPRPQSGDLGKLRAVITGSSALPDRVGAEIETLTGKPVLQIYGMTELSGICAAQPADGRSRSMAVGYPAPLIEMRFVHGEVEFRGPNVFAGYRTAEGATGRADDGWLCTGDLGTIGPDGQLRLSGRRKDVIIRGGHNIDPLMIDDAAQAHQDVLQAAAVAMPDAYAGEVPALFIVLRPGSTATLEEIGAFVSGRIAEPPARPKRLFRIDALPLTPVGKIAKYRLRQEAAVQVARENLADFPVATLECDDVAAKRIRITWRDASPEQQRTARTILEDLGLSLD